MELISKEVVRRIIDSGRTREQMLEMVESAVADDSSTEQIESSTDSSTEQIESSTDSSTDCISREAAISAAKHIFKSNSEMKAFCMMKMLEELPPAKPKKRTGEWQQDMDGTFLCSECGSGYKDQPTLMGKPMFAFCPICGAKMTESEDKE